MILVVGRREDAVLGRQRELLAAAGAPLLFVDERQPHGLRRSRSPRRPGWCVVGGEAQGQRPVDAVLIRRGPYGEAGRGAVAAFGRALDVLLLAAPCRVVNRPSASACNYSKPQQLLRLGQAGFAVPRTLVTASPDAARAFIVELEGRVLVKGLSSVRTRPEALGPEHLPLLDGVRQRPAQFQEIVEGREFRVTVLAGRAWATPVLPEPGLPLDAAAVLPAAVVQRCLRFVADEGLVLGGFDLIVDARGTCWCLELNPNPLITHYEDARDPLLSRALRDHLLASPAGCSALYA